MANNVFVGYPSSYREGMSNLGFHFVFGELKSRELMRVERFFTDTSPLTFESGLKISSAIALFFSFSFEEDYLNLVRILIDSGIEPSREERGCRPIIVVGGPAVSANPVPMSQVADIISIGEGEETVAKIAAFVEEYNGGGRGEILEKLSGVDGIFISGQPGKGVVFAHPEIISKLPMSILLSGKTVFSDMLLMEISRGCPGRCCFCLASAIYRPLRIQPYDSIMETLEEIPRFVNKIGLVSTSVTSHPDFSRIVEELIKRKIKTSFSSLRAEDIDNEKALQIGRTGTRSVALAPETGSEAMRFILGKKVPDDAYFNAANLLALQGIKRFTIYLLSGYPGETEQVINETRLFMEKFKKAVRRGIVSVHINIVIPKPWTPLQFYAMPERKSLERKLKELAGACEGPSRNIRIKSVRSSLRQAILSLGSDDVGKAVIEYGKGRISWNKALAHNDIDPGFIHDKGRVSQVLPWEFISGSINRQYLLRRYNDLMNKTGTGETIR
ncbi:radical SAM protein [bacterium]|nr:radical SAM protein [bacterium]